MNETIKNETASHEEIMKNGFPDKRPVRITIQRVNEDGTLEDVNKEDAGGICLFIFNGFGEEHEGYARCHSVLINVGSADIAAAITCDNSMDSVAAIISIDHTMRMMERVFGKDTGGDEIAEDNDGN